MRSTVKSAAKVDRIFDCDQDTLSMKKLSIKRLSLDLSKMSKSDVTFAEMRY